MNDCLSRSVGLFDGYFFFSERRDLASKGWTCNVCTIENEPYIVTLRDVCCVCEAPSPLKRRKSTSWRNGSFLICSHPFRYPHELMDVFIVVRIVFATCFREKLRFSLSLSFLSLVKWTENVLLLDSMQLWRWKQTVLCLLTSADNF